MPPQTQTQTQDPLANLGVEAVDPLANLGVEATTASAAPPAPTSDFRQVQATKIGPNTQASDIPTFGWPGQTPQERLSMPLVKLLIAAHDKLRDIENYTEAGKKEHPVQGALGDVANRIEGLLIGNPEHPEAGIGTGKYGVLTNPVGALIMPGGEVAGAMEHGAPIAEQVAKEAGTDIAQGIREASAYRKANPFRAVTRAANATDKAATAAAVDSGVAAAAVPPSEAGLRTALDGTIEQIGNRERATYDVLKKWTGTDMKSLYDERNAVQDALDDPVNIGNTKALQKRLASIDGRISFGEQEAAAKGVDARKVLQSAKTDTQQRYAVQELKKQVFNNESVVSGNVAAGADESINVNAAIKAVEKLDKPSRFAPEGTPTRLEQALGEDGAANFKRALYDAQKRGVRNAKLAQVVKWAGGLVGAGLLGGAGFEAAKHLVP